MREKSVNNDTISLMSLLACIVLSIGLLFQLITKFWTSSSCFTKASSSLRQSSSIGRHFNELLPIRASSDSIKAFPTRQERSHLPHFVPPKSFQHHNLSAVVLFRLFREDALHFNRTDLDQWMTFMSYAGVDHFYLYDNCLHENECQRDLDRRPDVTYTQWSHSEYMAFQTPAYNHHLQTHYPHSNFEMILDIDEFPFMLHDTEPGFLQRHVLLRNDSQFLVRTIFFGGPAIPSTSTTSNDHSWRIHQYTHRRPVAEKESRTKPIYQPRLVDSHGGSSNLHEMKMIYAQMSLSDVTHVDDVQVSEYDKYMGFNLAEDPGVLRLNHYWCERMISESTDVVDDSMQLLIEKVEQWRRLQVY